MPRSADRSMLRLGIRRVRSRSAILDWWASRYVSQSLEPRRTWIGAVFGTRFEGITGPVTRLPSAAAMTD
jgi:hypothetical protein